VPGLHRTSSGRDAQNMKSEGDRVGDYARTRAICLRCTKIGMRADIEAIVATARRFGSVWVIPRTRRVNRQR